MILDGNFIFTALRLKIDIRDRLQKMLQGETVKLFVLRSALDELKLVGDKAKSAVDFATSFCQVLEDDKGETASDRLIKFIEQNKPDPKATKARKFFVATQDAELRGQLSRVPGVPLLYLNQVTLVMEAPSRASAQFSSQVEAGKQTLGEEETAILDSIGAGSGVGGKRKGLSSSGSGDGAAPTETDKQRDKVRTLAKDLPAGTAVVARKKHKANAPNPLSSAKPSEDSANSMKKKQRKFRKFY
mmetsp:Transcript_13551/g.29896  ORF Transcript_13551/g.29896 Transcript_13551/m.29896 type:complete len:244 (-) Transcript_13551:109-840(-)